MATPKSSVAEIITARIVELLEKGTVPWNKPWTSVAPQNLISRKPYRGVNAFLLNALGFESPYFVTFNQAKQLGGSVKKGQKGTPVVFWQFIEKTVDGVEKKFPLLRYYTVFSVAQCEGIEAPALTAREAVSPIEACERLVEGMPMRPEIHHGGNQAFYSPRLDEVRMPAMAQFNSSGEYYGTLFHELSHATGHSSRLARKGVAAENVRFGSETYSEEELLAEMAASFLCGHAGIEGTLPNSAAYIAGWLKVLKNDKNFIVKAAGGAQKAADFILGKLEPETAASEE